MKYRYSFLIIFAILFFSCKSTNSPKAVTETFLVSVARLDIKTAKNYSTRQTWDFLKLLEQSTEDIPAEDKEDFIKDFKVKIIEEKKINDSTYTVKFTTTPQLLPFEEIFLKGEKNIEGNIRWKVDIATAALAQADTTIQEVMVPGVDSLGEFNVSDTAAY